MLMCIAIMNGGKMLPKKKLSNCWTYNDDGAGMLFIQDGKLVAEKFPNIGGDSFDKFYQRYTEVKSSVSGEQPMLLHFRIATHGMSEEYLHPFFVTPELGLVHNGVIRGFGSQDKSDTAEFTELLSTIPNVSMEMLDNLFIEDAIYEYLGGTNKLIFLDNEGEYRIFGEKLGEWIGDNWFSNDSHTKAIRYYGSTAVTSGSTYSYDWDDAYADDDEELKAYNASFFNANDYDADSVEEFSEIAFDEKAPLHGTYDCNVCETEDTDVNFNSECMKCRAYLLDAVDEVMDLWEEIDYQLKDKS